MTERPKKKKKQKHGPIPTYETRKAKQKSELAENDWLTAPDPAARRYDSSLSMPGRLCRRCRSFIAGDLNRVCPECWAT